MGDYIIQEVHVMDYKKLNKNNPVSPDLHLSKFENGSVDRNDDLYLDFENACCSPEFTKGCIFYKMNKGREFKNI